MPLLPTSWSQQPDQVHNSEVKAHGAKSDLYYYTLYDAYVLKHGLNLEPLKEMTATGFHLR